MSAEAGRGGGDGRLVIAGGVAPVARPGAVIYTFFLVNLYYIERILELIKRPGLTFHVQVGYMQIARYARIITFGAGFSLPIKDRSMQRLY